MHRCLHALRSGAGNRAWRRHLSTSHSASAHVSLLQRFDEKVKAGALTQDPRQYEVVRRLARLSEVLADYTPPRRIVPLVSSPKDADVPGSSSSSPASAASTASVSSASANAGSDIVDGDASGLADAPDTASGPSPAPTAPGGTTVRVPRGLYIHGEVGSGKSLLMDMFFECLVLPDAHHWDAEGERMGASGDAAGAGAGAGAGAAGGYSSAGNGINTSPRQRKRRVHFHQFMLEVHGRVHALKQRALREEGRRQNIDLDGVQRGHWGADPVRAVAREIAAGAWVLCFDEFQVTDVADALIMRALFEELWRCGTVCVFTTNRPPSALYEGGVNREYFLPWIDALKRHCGVVAVSDGCDHRTRTAELPGQYHWPLTPAAGRAMEAQLVALTDGRRMTAEEVPVMMGRTLAVPRAAAGVCAFEFAQLCEQPLYAADYRALAENYHTLVLSSVPSLDTAKHNEARRFITLIDEMYEARIRVVLSAETSRERLFTELSTRVPGSAGWEPLQGAAKGGFGTDRPGGPAARAPTPPTVRREPKSESQSPPPLLPSFPTDPQSDDVGVLEGELAAVTELAFAFRRASSRLREMASLQYLETHAIEHAPRYAAHGLSLCVPIAPAARPR